MIQRLLIANRGEIACRVIRTCRRLGVHTIAVFSDADRNAVHTRMADEAHHIGGAAPTDSYLSIDKILTVAKVSNADAVHPGYGFLSENPDFVRACEAQQLIFVGPNAATMEQMGSKADAKAVMIAAGVPTVPGYHDDDQSLEILVQQAEQTGFPLMIKATAGGGGKGMRIVEHADKFATALESARREARNAFGDDRVILERYLNDPRHIEVQVFGDMHANVVHLFERDCSSQRRYQKVIEETPSSLLDDQQRQAMFEAAVAAAKAVDYVNAGTVEFIVDGGSGEFFFMEMNTRLQVEHPVTEMVTGQDLVEWQLRIAAGEQLPLQQGQLTSQGHAFEARIYAEDPNNGFLPSAGHIDWLSKPDHVRFDSGVEQGGVVTVHYDPMIAKLIVHGADRPAALAKLEQALAQTTVVGLQSNLDFLLKLCREPIFRDGKIHTAYLDQQLEALLDPQHEPPTQILIAGSVIQLLSIEAEASSKQQVATDPHSPWAMADGWRLGHYGRRIVSLAYRDHHYTIDGTGFAGDYQIRIDEQSFDVQSARLDQNRLNLTIDGQQQAFTVLHRAPWMQVASTDRLYQFVAEDPFAVETSDGQAQDQLIAPMPGKIVAIKAKIGDSVTTGQDLIVMEAMKMELTLSAPRDGQIESIPVATDDFVEADALVLKLTQDQDSD